MQRIVLTGGPGAGKTTIMEKLKKERIFQKKIIFVPEAAVMLLSSGFPVPGQDLEWSPNWQRAFQSVVFPLQKSLEDIYAFENKKACILLCDRGLLDGAAYISEKIDKFCQKFGVNKKAILSRYIAVIHLESLATANPKEYKKLKGQNFRFENLEKAQIIEMKTRKVWKDHPNYFFIEGNQGLREKTLRVLEIIKSFIK